MGNGVNSDDPESATHESELSEVQSLSQADSILIWQSRHIHRDQNQCLVYFFTNSRFQQATSEPPDIG